ncbi:baseplate spike [Burkholderia phage BcepB1A]|uniref:baseplate spike n=1 Tax=Burkholderia phage BcepB1A TaxID=279530 RepID=UPI00003779C1|nr:baseplate spike [Burkholderia phage BcepB1A]AAT37774.1 gp10 V [Burkholderia phage BcepB1A]
MTTPIIPSKNPADDGSAAGVLRTIFRKQSMQMDGQLPAVVLSYDRTKNRATVRPLISMLKTNMQPVQRASIATVPVLALGGGGYVMTFPVKAGDLGWIEASDRDISLFMQSMQQSHPNTYRIHSFNDGRFVPDAFAKYVINAEDNNAATIQSLDGSVRIALDIDELRLTAPNIKINAGTLFEVTAPAIALHQTGGGTGATFTGSPVVMPDAVIAGVTQSTHIHDDPQGGQVGPPHN